MALIPSVMMQATARCKLALNHHHLLLLARREALTSCKLALVLLVRDLHKV